MNEQLVIQPATASDVAAVEQLLRRAELPTQGLADQFPTAYVVAREAGRVVGAGGIERYAAAGLLRSVVVAPTHRRRGVAARIVERLLSDARDAGLGDVYLLTTTAAEYFERIGFVAMARDGAPPAVLQAPEFASICPTSARCLVWPKSPASFRPSARDRRQENPT